MSTTRVETKKLSTRFQKNLFSFENISSRTPRGYAPKTQAMQTLQRCGVAKDLQRMLVDHNYQIEQGEIQQRSSNTTTPSSRQTEIRSLKGFFCRQMLRLSSTFSQELDVAAPHSHWHVGSDCFDTFSNPDQQPPAVEHQLRNCISKEHDKQQALLRKELCHIRQVACEAQLVSLHISDCR